MKKELKKIIKTFEDKHDAKLVFLAYTGSTLYGTNSKASDADFKGVFLNSKRNILLKDDVPHYVYHSNEKTKNNSDDVDLTLYSVQRFFELLRKSETGGIDLLFSMFCEDAVVYQDDAFVELMTKDYKRYLNTNMKSFIGYALGQTKKFGIKGDRYNDLSNFLKWFEAFMFGKEDQKLGAFRDELEDQAAMHKYVKVEDAPGARNKQTLSMYLTVLGKMFEESATIGYVYDKLHLQFNQFGNRTKAVAETVSKTDFKALSHSLRIAAEVKELLQTQFIKFPLHNAEYLKEIKYGMHNVEKVVQEIEDTLAEVDVLLETSEVPEESDKAFMDSLVLSLYE